MSKRLVLLSGTPRAGTTTLAKAAVREAERHGYRTSLVSVEDLDIDTLRRAHWPTIAEALTLLMPHLDLTDRDSADFAQLPGIDELLIWRAVASGVQAAGDVVVVDAGQVDRLIAAVSWLETVDDLIESMNTPQLVEGVESAPSVLTALRTALGEIRLALFDAQTTVRLVTTPDDAEEAARTIAGVSLAGLHVDGVIINMVPRRKDGWPKPWTKQQRAKVRAAADLLGALPVARVRLRAGKPSVSLARHFGLDTAWTPPPMAAVEATAAGYRWTVPFLDPLEQPIRVGYRGDAAFVQVGAYRRRFAMPSVVRRCVITEAEVRPGTLTMVCQPNPEVWPR